MWGANAKLHGVKCGKVLVVWGFIEPPHVIARLKKPRQRNSLPGPALVGELVAGKVGLRCLNLLQRLRDHGLLVPMK